MISYAGIELTLPNDELMGLLDTVYPVQELLPFMGKRITEVPVPEGTPVLSFDRPYATQVNEVYWPTSPLRWAYGSFLATDTQLQCLREAIGNTLFNECIHVTSSF